MTRRTVWIINPYGTLPSEPWATYRSTMIAECLADHGYDVIQFISNFEHRSKTFRTESHEVVRVRDGYTIEIVPGTGYRSHVSIARVRHERAYARNLLRAIRRTPPPDYIILAEPALCYYDILLAPLIASGRSKLILDVIDIWPELFELVIPKPLRVLSRPLLAPLYYWRRRLYAHSSAVVAVAQDYIDVARDLIGKSDVPLEVIYWSCDPRNVAPRESPAVQELIARKQPGEIWIVYAGTLGENYDIQSIIQVAQPLSSRLSDSHRVRFLIAGDGPFKGLCEANANENFIFLGPLAAAQLPALYRHSDIALTTYKGESTVAMPIKAFDYLRYGLPIVNSLGRDMGRLIRKHGVGVNYQAGSPASLHRALERIIVDEDARGRASANARALATEFDAARQYAKFVHLLRTLEAADCADRRG